MRDQQREIVNMVASGQLTPAEAAARLEALGREPHPQPQRLGPAPAVAVAPGRVVRVVSNFGSAEVVGDPNVSFAVAEGPHRARQDGDPLVIEHGPIFEDDTFSFSTGRRYVNGLEHQNRNIIVRMNPDLVLVANVRAGNVKVSGVHGPITAEVQMGNCRIDDFKSPINAIVQAGNVNAQGRLDGGESKVRCEMGSIRLTLDKGSSVRVTAHSSMGKVTIDGGTGRHKASGDVTQDVTIGAGAGKLDVDCTMGSVRVIAD